ncbi:hypothetical protein LO772_19080 [Yinghuangia sp. ASG 101]|uniref:hypothetical protein n=1 Tax=Yinghuangia sp. ASG 101 TaxID=2896848 RepID=UPI001E2A8E1C|nr:hypothetical protein [Yinghuangia sp. ASG 101]UGQ09071.1 hypothetical protein LO772_19080 [Yinghuangia sp. ASG 101]
MLSSCAALGYVSRRPVAICVYGLVATAVYYVFGAADAPAQMVVLMIALYVVAGSGRRGPRPGWVR